MKLSDCNSGDIVLIGKWHYRVYRARAKSVNAYVRQLLEDGTEAECQVMRPHTKCTLVRPYAPEAKHSGEEYDPLTWRGEKH